MGLVGGKKAPNEPDPNAAPISKAGKVWGKIQKARTKVIKYITEEDDQERAKILKTLVDDYKLHGRLSSDREIRVHYDSEIRRFLCPICGAKFVKEGNLMSHIELVEMASATDKASKIHDRRFGFENRSVKLAADIDMLYRSIRSSGQPMPHRVFSHNVHSEASEEKVPRANDGVDRRRSAHRLRRQSPFAIPLNARNPGRDIDDEDENEEMDRSLKALRPRRRRRGSPLSPPLGRTPSNASNASVTPSLPSPTPNSSSPDYFSRGNSAWRRPGAVVPHALPRSASNASIANSETSSASARPFTAPDTGFAGKRWMFDEITEEGLDHITPVPDQRQTPHWKFYLPAYVQRAGNVSLRRQMLKANNGGFTKTGYVSIREKAPDLFADTITGRVEPSQEEGKTETSDRWLPYDPLHTTSQEAARITCTVRPLSRQESHANALTMELRNYRHVLEWIGLDIDAQGRDGGESGEGGAGEVGEAIPSSLPEYFASKPALAAPGGAQALQATSRPHEYYRRHVVDKRRVPGSNSSRAQTARLAGRKSIGRHLL
jgi:hypothetical protein